MRLRPVPERPERDTLGRVGGGRGLSSLSRTTGLQRSLEKRPRAASARYHSTVTLMVPERDVVLNGSHHAARTSAGSVYERKAGRAMALHAIRGCVLGRRCG